MFVLTVDGVMTLIGVILLVLFILWYGVCVLQDKFDAWKRRRKNNGK